MEEDYENGGMPSRGRSRVLDLREVRQSHKRNRRDHAPLPWRQTMGGRSASEPVRARPESDKAGDPLSVSDLESLTE